MMMRALFAAAALLTGCCVTNETRLLALRVHEYTAQQEQFVEKVAQAAAGADTGDHVVITGEEVNAALETAEALTRATRTLSGILGQPRIRQEGD